MKLSGKRKNQPINPWVLAALIATTLIVLGILAFQGGTTPPAKPTVALQEIPTRFPTMRPVEINPPPVLITKQTGCITDPQLNFPSLVQFVQNKTNYTLVANGSDEEYIAERSNFVYNYKVPKTERFEEVRFAFPKGLSIDVVCGVLLKYDSGKWLFAPLAEINEVNNNSYKIATIIVTGAIPLESEPKFSEGKEVKKP